MQPLGPPVADEEQPVAGPQFRGRIGQDLGHALAYEHEGGDITGIKIDSVDAAKEAAKKLLSDGVRNVIITLGGDGAVYTDAGKVYAHSAVRVDNVVDTTAAGDCFCGAAAKCLACGGTIHNAIAYATAASAITVTKKGAQASIPTHEQVEKLRKELGI